MTIQQQLQSLLTTKAQLRTALQQKGVSVPESTLFREYPAKIAEIPTVDLTFGNLTFEVIGGAVYPHTLTLKNLNSNIDLKNSLRLNLLKKLVLQSGIVSIPGNFLTSASRLESIELPQGLKSIGLSSFYQCTALKAVTIPSSVTALDNGIFSYCSGLTTLDIQANVVELPQYFASECYSLVTVTLSASIKTLGSSVFANNSKLQNINLENITAVGEYCFNSCKELKRLIIPNLIYSSLSSFSGLTALTEVDLGQVSLFYGYTLSSSPLLKQLILKNPTKCEIRTLAFSGMTGLKYIEINAQTLVLSSSSFSGLSACEAVKIDAITPPVVSGAPFAGFNASIFKIYVPDASVDTYKTKSGWTTLAAYIFPMSQFVMPTI